MDMFFVLLVSCFLFCCKSELYDDTYDESLLIKPLNSGHVYTQFSFVVQKDIGNGKEGTFQHFRLFPRSLGEILSQLEVQELHLSLTQGLWRHASWGYPARSAPPGAEIWAVFAGNASQVSSNWKKLTNVLSGQFCASLNFIDEANTITPQFSFRPDGAISEDFSFNSNFIRYSSLPHEVVCTENLTPFRKLLPCGAQAGLATLLNALNIFNANFVSLAVDVQTVCKKNCASAAIELRQSVSIVFDPPVKQQGKQDWSFVKLFGSSLTNVCPLASKSRVFVDITSNSSGVPFTLNSKPTELIQKQEEHSPKSNVLVLYDLKDMLANASHVNIGATYISQHIYGIVLMPEFYAERKIIGYGQENSGIQCIFFNNHPKKSLKILYTDMIPWYLRLYSHTLKVTCGDKNLSPDLFSYQPALDRQRPHLLEVVLNLPPQSKTEMNVEFDFAFLKWTEYPPDANHGFYVGSAVVTTVLSSEKNFTILPSDGSYREEKGFFLRLYTHTLLVAVPTPDFSMPYNVICLTCTVVALAFGPIHHVTTKSLHPLDESDKENLLSKLKKRVKVWWSSKDETINVTEDSKEEETKKTL